MTFSGRTGMQGLNFPAMVDSVSQTLFPGPDKIKAMKLDEKASAARAHSTDAGIDLVSIEDVSFQPGEIKMVPTGIAVEIPVGCVGLLLPRSSIATKRGLMLINSVGVIDADYRGEIMAVFVKVGGTTAEIKAGERVAQLVIVPTLLANVEFVDTLDETERGVGGFGSTGE